LGAGIAAGILGQVIAGQTADEAEALPNTCRPPSFTGGLVECSQLGDGPKKCTKAGGKCWPFLNGVQMATNPDYTRDGTKRKDYSCACVK
jgi:hypothetical protein